MISVGLYYEVKAGREKEFEEAFRMVREQLAKSDGLTLAHLYKRVDKPNSYQIYSEWKSLEHFRRFISSEAFRSVTRSGLELLESLPRNKVYELLGSFDDSSRVS